MNFSITTWWWHHYDWEDLGVNLELVQPTGQLSYVPGWKPTLWKQTMR